jgi:hypothetical protein
VRHGAARSEPARGGSALDQVPYWVALCGIAAGLLVVRLGGRDVRGGTLVIAGVFLAAAVTRLALPNRRAGMLASRRRLVDVAAFGLLGAGLLVAGLIFPAPG